MVNQLKYYPKYQSWQKTITSSKQVRHITSFPKGKKKKKIAFFVHTYVYVLRSSSNKNCIEA